MDTVKFEGTKRHALLASVSTVAAFAALCYGAGGAAAASCESLAGKIFGGVTITAATAITPPFSVMGKDPPAPVTVKAPFCRVEGSIKPSQDSDIAFEVWLPPAPAWNGKYEGVGNGGFAGSLIYSPMEWALEAGYAVSGTDTGHSGGTLDAAWALGHPEKIVDFGWRAIHEIGGRVQGDRRSLLRESPRAFLFQRLLRRRPGSALGSSAFPQGL